jgi:hypothetical protein
MNVPRPHAREDRRRRLPPRRLPILYFGFAHLCLGLTFAAAALDPAGLAGFFYHPRLISAVHFVTLGWVSASILGALHLVGPMALRAPMPARRIDGWVFAGFALGSTGVASHFFISEFSGVGWSGLLVTAAFVQVGFKTLRALRQARIPPEVALHFRLAFGNALLAAVAGVLLGFNKHAAFLPGRAMTHAFAHAHLATLGWGLMMVFAAGYRLLPMLLPAAMPSGAGVWASAVLLEAGVLAVFASLLVPGPWLGPAAVVAALGIAAFFSQLGWMLRHRKPPPKARPAPDIGVLQVLQALLYLALATVLGVVLAFSPTSEESLRLVWVYGVAGLLGFLSQMVVGVSHRLLPLYAWLVSFGASGWSEIPPTPHETPDRRLQGLTFLLWTAGVPVLASGFYLDRPGIVSLGGWLLLAAVVAGGASHAVVLRRLSR